MAFLPLLHNLRHLLQKKLEYHRHYERLVKKMTMDISDLVGVMLPFDSAISTSKSTLSDSLPASTSTSQFPENVHSKESTLLECLLIDCKNTVCYIASTYLQDLRSCLL